MSSTPGASVTFATRPTASVAPVPHETMSEARANSRLSGPSPNDPTYEMAWVSVLPAPSAPARERNTSGTWRASSRRLAASRAEHHASDATAPTATPATSPVTESATSAPAQPQATSQSATSAEASSRSTPAARASHSSQALRPRGGSRASRQTPPREEQCRQRADAQGSREHADRPQTWKPRAHLAP